jgi:hypothetical protein
MNHEVEKIPWQGVLISIQPRIRLTRSFGMHPFPALGSLKPPGYTEQHSSAELIGLSASTSGLPHSFLFNVQAFQAEASLWVVMVLMTGFFERYPKLRAAVFEASSTWLSFILGECDKRYRLYRNERQLPPLKRLPSETFFEYCVTGFEGDEAPPSRLPEFYENILAWSSDVYHHDGDDAWRARDDAQLRAAGEVSGKVPRRERAPALQNRRAEKVHH